MIKVLSNKFFKRVAVILFAFFMVFVFMRPATSFALTSFVARLWVPSIPTYNVPGIPGNYLATEVYTIPEGEYKLTIAIRAITNTGDPTSTHAVLQQMGTFGWKNIAGDWIATDKEPKNPWGIMNVKPGEKYRLICSCTKGNDLTSSIDIVAAFVSQ